MNDILFFLVVIILVFYFIYSDYIIINKKFELMEKTTEKYIKSLKNSKETENEKVEK